MATRSTPNNVIEIAAKYMHVLGIETPPEIIIVDNLGSEWLGECHWRSSRPVTTTIRIQKRILAHPTTLDRVLAHELVHHWEFQSLTPDQVSLIRLGIRTGHGAEFIEGSKIINSLMGESYVTKTSDSSYEQDVNTKVFYLLIMRMSPRNDRLGWAWAARLSPQGKERIAKECNERGGKLIMTTDERWLTGTKIARFGGMSLPHEGSPDEAELRHLYDNATPE
jgi:hypothetical protein